MVRGAGERVELTGREGGGVGPDRGGLLSSSTRAGCEKAAHGVEGREHVALAEQIVVRNAWLQVQVGYEVRLSVGDWLRQIREGLLLAELQLVSADYRASASGNVVLDLLARLFHVLFGPSHLEEGLLVAGGRHDVGAGLLLDALYGRALWSHHQAHHVVGDLDRNGVAVLFIGGVGACSRDAGAPRPNADKGVTCGGLFPLGADLSEVVCRG